MDEESSELVDDLRTRVERLELLLMIGRMIRAVRSPPRVDKNHIMAVYSVRAVGKKFETWLASRAGPPTW